MDNMRSTSLAIFAILTMIFVLQGCVSTSTIREELGDLKNLNVPASWRNSSVVLLEYTTDLQFIVDSEGNRVKEVETKWYRVNNLNDTDAQYISVPEQTFFETPVKIAAEAYYPDGSSWTLVQSKIRQHEMKFSDNVIHQFFVPKYQQDTLIKVEVQREYTRPEFVGRYNLGDVFPVVKRTITLSYPDNVTLVNGVENIEDAECETSIIVEDGFRTHSITAKNVVNFQEKDRTQYPEEYYALFHVSFPPKGKESYTWKELGNHYLNLSNEPFTTTKEIDQLASTIPDNTPTGEKITQAFSTVINKIRYHFNSRGGYAFYPREASEVLKNGFGDCKELTTILKSMFDGTNIASYPVLISTWGNEQLVLNYPSLTGFNHMVLAVETGDGDLRILDGTHSWANSRSSYYASVGRKAFILEPDNSRIDVIGRAEDYENRVVTSSTIEKGEDGRWVIRGEIHLLGYPALRFYESLQSSSRKDEIHMAGKMLKSGFDIFAEDIGVKKATADEAVIVYLAGFDENNVSLGKGGFKLNTPGLFQLDVEYQVTDKLGKVYLPEFQQEDTWIIPFVPSKTELPQINTSLAISVWEVTGNSVQRKYFQNESKMSISSDTVLNWDSYLGELKNSVVWR